MQTSVNSPSGWPAWDWEVDVRAVFGVLSLLIVVAVIGMLAKKQLTSLSAPIVPPAGAPANAAPATPQQQVQQFGQTVQGAMQQTRPMPDEGK
jgi:hypothetical protein